MKNTITMDIYIHIHIHIVRPLVIEVMVKQYSCYEQINAEITRDMSGHIDVRMVRRWLGIMLFVLLRGTWCAQTFDSFPQERLWI